MLLDLVLVLGDQALPALGGELGHPVEPARIELGALIVLEEVLARDAVAFGQPHQAALVADQALVDVVELLDQRIDARLVEPQRLHLGDDLVLELLVFALLRGRQRRALELELDVLVLQPAQPLVGVGDVVEGLQHLGLELGLDRGERERALHVVLVEIGLRRARSGFSSPSHRRAGALNGVAPAGAVAGAAVCGGSAPAPGRRRSARRRPAGRRARSPPAPACPWRRDPHRSPRGR